MTLFAPIARRGNILGIGFNDADHIEEAGQPSRGLDLVTRAVTSVADPGGAIELPRCFDNLD